MLRRLAEAALLEDAGAGDPTTELTVPGDLRGSARIVAREGGVVSGLPVAKEVFRCVDEGLDLDRGARDGDRIEAGAVLLRISGRIGPILTAERTALNFLQRMSGIATLASRYVEAVEGTGARVVDTRKTTPGLRHLEKYAVRCGGGRNHRRSLGDGFLLKDNHRAALARAGIPLAKALRDARTTLPHTLRIEVEVDRLEDLDEALGAGAEVLLLDNLSLDELRAATERAAGKALLEASGGITLESIRDVAETGVHFISVGALTHSAPALDLALELDEHD